MAKISLEKWIEIHRRYWLRHDARTPLQVKFGNDPEVFNFIYNSYKYMQWLNRGNEADISEIPYSDWAIGIVDPTNYAYGKEEFADEPVLLAELKKLHKRYANLYKK